MSEAATGRLRAAGFATLLLAAAVVAAFGGTLLSVSAPASVFLATVIQLLFVAPGVVIVQYFTADYVWRRAVVAELAKGDFLPKNPYYIDDPLHYYWLPHLLDAVDHRVRPGVDLDELPLPRSGATARRSAPCGSSTSTRSRAGTTTGCRSMAFSASSGISPITRSGICWDSLASWPWPAALARATRRCSPWQACCSR